MFIIAVPLIPSFSKLCMQARNLSFQESTMCLGKKSINKRCKIPAHILLSGNEWKPDTQISLACPKKNQLNISATISYSPVSYNIISTKLVEVFNSPTNTNKRTVPCEYTQKV